MWQDKLIGAMNVIFILALISTIRNPDQKPTLVTSVSTAGAISVIMVAFFTLKFWFVAIANVILAAEWWILAWQRYKLNVACGKPHFERPHLSKLALQVLMMD